MKKIFALLLSVAMIASSIPMNNALAMNEVKPNAVAPSTVSSDNITIGTVAPGAVVAGQATSGGATTDAVAPSIIKEEPTSSANNPSNEELESAIKAVKAKITIPKEYTEFNYYFYNTSSYADSYWSLTWRNPIDSSYIQVNCDQGKHITYFNQYDYTEKNSSLPSYLQKELKSTADEFIKMIAPEVSSKLEYIDATYEGIYSGNYVYNYQRKENGVMFPDNTVSISVNSVTKEIKSASLHWLYDVAVPTSELKLTKEEAAKLIKENMTMKLTYRTNNYRIYDSYNPYYPNNNGPIKAFLVYEPSINYISVDAKTGKIYLTRAEWIERTTNEEAEKAAEGAGMASDSDTAAQVVLTEAEIAKIEELKKLISREAAIKVITSNKSLYLDKTLKSYSATLNKSGDRSSDSYVWSIQLSDPREIKYDDNTSDYYRAYASAQVDAKTGKILSFYASIKSLYDEKNQKWNTVKIPYDKEECQVILEKFLNSQIKSRFTKSKLVVQNDDYVAYYKIDVPVFGGFHYQYNRFNEGVEYSYNGINGSVDGVTGKIYSYSYNWDDNVTFESPVGAMTPEQAMDQYLSKDGYELVYEINQVTIYDPNFKTLEKYYDSSDAYTVNYEIRLVYSPDVYPTSISPFTGDQLDYAGEVYKVTKPYSYLDIPDTKENREILLLADMNIGFEGDYFKPNTEITIGELNDLMKKVGYGYGYSEEKDIQSTKLINREELAQNFIIKLGLEKVSGLKGIYKTGYADEYNIDEEYLGAVAIAKGFGLLEADAYNNFNPKSNITRAEAVHLILNYIGIQQSGINY